MKRTTWNWHDCSVRNLVFVVVLATSASIAGSHRNYEGRRNLRGESFFPRALLTKGHRGIDQSEEKVNLSEFAAEEPEETPREIEFYPQPSEVHVEAPQSDLEASIPRIRSRNCTPCIVLLLKQHPRICQIVPKLQELQILVPRLDEVVRRRMGGRRMDLKFMVAQGMGAVDQLFETMKRLAGGIRKFVKFLGTADGIFEPTFSSVDTFLSKFEEIDWWSEKKPIDVVEESPDEDVEVQGEPDARRSLTTCASKVMSLGIDVCGVLAKMNRMDGFLGGYGDPRLKEEPEIVVKLHPEDLALGGFLEAVQQSLLGGSGVAVLEVGAVENMWRGFGTIEKWSSQGRRYLVNEDEEEVAEVFETPDFRVEFVAQGEIPRSGDAPNFGPEDSTGNSDGMVEKPQRRSMHPGQYRSLGFDDDNARRRVKSLTEGRPVVSRGALERLPKRTVRDEQNGAILSSRHAPRSLRKIGPLDDNEDRLREEVYKPAEQIRQRRGKRFQG